MLLAVPSYFGWLLLMVAILPTYSCWHQISKNLLGHSLSMAHWPFWDFLVAIFDFQTLWHWRLWVSAPSATRLVLITLLLQSWGWETQFGWTKLSKRVEIICRNTDLHVKTIFLIYHFQLNFLLRFLLQVWSQLSWYKFSSCRNCQKSYHQIFTIETRPRQKGSCLRTPFTS